ncbi:hypothetical protein GOB94_14100 [Granulicella sp. 5B5]|uniref:hypothetical protein n=1 Tax=Granulicella sp. 5B5 TaxID=1617967 RepID=UPI0015F692A8|nr:hypothetical protein [Granulicella sp. 5B5]QMV19698.1 hypothetical protein GOB94_14100 [Granulicella sp. 5B5]
MPITTITLDGNAVTLVPLPSSPAPKSVSPWMSDSVALITSPFTGQTQAQGSTGADLTGLMVTYPPLNPKQAAPLLAWLAEMRGMANAVQMTPPEYKGPQGAPSGTPTVNSTASGTNQAGSYTLVTRGWRASAANLLLPWDAIQFGYRLHRIGITSVSSDASGNATFNIYPSLREDVADGTPIITANPMGLYRLAQNKRDWVITPDFYTALSFPLVEYR